MKLIEYTDVEKMMVSVADIVAAELADHLAENQSASLAVAGGTTPGPIFDVLAVSEIDWGRVSILLTDERWVPVDHERSNTRLLHERLLTDCAALANYVSLYTGDEDAETGAAVIAAEVAALAQLTVVILGMGADMHTASLFPGSVNLAAGLAEDAPAVIAVSGGGAPEPRVSLTLPILAGALNRHLVIKGTDKRAALEKAMQISNPMLAPVAAILPCTTVHWAE